MQALQENIELALVSRCQAEVQMWEGHQYHYYVGTITEMDLHTRTIVCGDSLKAKRLFVDMITSVQLLD